MEINLTITDTRRLTIYFVVLLLLLGVQPIWAQSYTLTDKWVDAGNGVQINDPYYSETSTVKWDGASKNGKANGYGTLTKYNNGQFESKFEGYYKNGIREGKGKFTHMDGSVKEGIFVNGQLTGKGIMTTEDGHRYEGEFINYRMHGKGKLTWANGSSFEGFFVSDVPYTGKFTDYTGEVTYIQKGEPVERINEVRSGYSPKIGQRVTEYFDEEWNRCQAEDAAYYRLITYSSPNTPKGVVRDFYISGQIQSEQYPIYINYADEGMTFMEGKQTFYHENGNVSTVLYYYNNKPNGPIETYYPSGNLESKAKYEYGLLNGDAISYFENGKIKSVSKYKNGDLLNNKFLLFTEDGMSFLMYNEDFDRNHEAWEYQGQSGIMQPNGDGTISMQVSPERTITGGIYTGFAPMSENIISVVTNQREQGSVVTLLFGFKDWDNFCSLSIYKNLFQFIYRKNGVMVQNDEWMIADCIKPDINQLQVVNSDDKITFYINETPVGQVRRIYYDGSLCGVSVYNPTSSPVVIDATRLVVQEVVDPDNIPEEYLPSSAGSEGDWTGNGTGFFVSDNGYIATNYHVVEGAKAIQVTFTRNNKAESYPAKVVISDKENDLAILKIDSISVDAIPYALLTRIKDTGSEVFTLGYPIADVMGTEVKFTDGKISSKSGIQGDVRVYQITVPIQPGNSGGPLFDMIGNVVGITSSGLNKKYFQSENVNYAVKSSYLKTLIDSSDEKIEVKESTTTNTDISSDISLTERIKQYEEYVVLIETK